jgi:vancomycin permeability regulator SanA
MKRRIWRSVAGVAVLGLLVGLGPTGFALAAAAGRVSSVADVPAQPVAIVFGAGLDPSGDPMPYLSARLDLAARLYHDGRAKVILVSGDNRRADYNEPDAMRAYLINAGVAADRVVPDYAGRDTYSTCVRAKRIFGVDAAVLVSQTYHLPRALAACRSVGIDSWAVGDDSVNSTKEWGGYAIREIPANIKLVWDLATGRKPVLGDPESSVRDALAK